LLWTLVTPGALKRKSAASRGGKKKRKTVIIIKLKKKRKKKEGEGGRKHPFFLFDLKEKGGEGRLFPSKADWPGGRGKRRSALHPSFSPLRRPGRERKREKIRSVTSKYFQPKEWKAGREGKGGIPAFAKGKETVPP